VNLVDGGMVLALGQDAWGFLVLLWCCSGDRLGGWVRVRSSPGCLSVLRAFTGSGSAALIHSRSFVGSGSGSGSGSGGGGCDDMRHRYALPICTTDMHRRYARHENRKGQEQYALGPDIVCDSLLYFCWSIHLIIFPISVGTMRARNSSN